jgi:uncharacterized circularly permuted ATP-grasp superfamily protein/uncharacterized alpha-E superfamily protein
MGLMPSSSVTSQATGSPLQPDGPLREVLLDPARLAERQAQADRLLEADGAGHLVHDLPVRADGRVASIESRPWRVDPIPVVLDGATFRWLSRAVSERMRALDAVIGDLYGERVLVRDRVVPAEALAATERYRINAVGATPVRWLSTYAVDVVLGADGVWYVLQDLTDAPPGIGYALLDRSVMSRVHPQLMGSNEIASIARYTGAVRRALAAASTADSPRIVLFSGGLDHPSYVDHSYLAVQLGVHLVEGADLVVRQRRVWLRTLDGLEPVDVLYRRLEDSTVDPLEIAAHGSLGVPGLLQAVRSRGVALANAHGSGVVEASTVVPFVEEAIARLAPMEQSLARLADLDAPLATVPTAPAAGAVGVEAPVVIRLFAVSDGFSVSVLSGGTGRVLAPGDDPRFPTACLAKDVWVLGRTTAPVIGPRLPQVDFGRSLPTRAADALYWTNRSAERAEAMARTARIVASRLEQDPGLALLDGGGWERRMNGVLHAVRRSNFFVDTEVDRSLAAELDVLNGALADEIGSLLTGATTVREYLSVTTGRVLAHLAGLRTRVASGSTGVDDLDAVITDFAALAGMWHESIVRGPAWLIGDTGRRLERALVVIDLVQSAIGLEPVAGAGEPNPEIEAASIEVLLAANDSLVAYRRRHRSDVELDAAVALIVHDETNPRSLISAIDLLESHAVEGEWEIGIDLARQARAALELPLRELLPAARHVIEEIGSHVVARWFSSPVSPIMMRPTDQEQQFQAQRQLHLDQQADAARERADG